MLRIIFKYNVQEYVIMISLKVRFNDKAFLYGWSLKFRNKFSEYFSNMSLNVEFNYKYEGQYITYRYICLCLVFNINLRVRYKDKF
jgi:hypothetical protein